MKNLILITTLISICTSTTLGQTFDKIATHHFGNKQLNQTDSQGYKQGLWIHYEMFFDSQCSALSAQDSDTCFRQLNKGHYKDNKKIGTWEYYNDGGCYFSTDRIEIYYKNGSVKETKYWYSTMTDYSSDTSLVISTVAHNKDTIQIECKDKQSCIATLQDKKLIEFDFEKLDFEQYRLASGIYNREIRILKE